ncbi:dTDP-4-dehydrorhamnose reductase [Candidatus Pseudothioglobus sp. Uisw_016]|uniref:dTDP-4-dehydrorhamnose reductase n=1 Tax=Candidatus Pseudothioglobus sp. Uisw_016 TaxID=3230995 RepID=UPI003A881267
MMILVIGKNGQLGKSIKKVLANSVQHNKYIFVGRESLDLSKKSSINDYFKNNSFDLIINCAAYTKVDKAEAEFLSANQINNLAVAQLSVIAKKQNSKLIHISTDYVFDGKNNKKYRENDQVNPINVYGKTKLAGEQAIIKEMLTNAIIIRTSWLYSEFGNNFVITMLRLGQERREINVINDQIGTPTYAIDLANVILNIVNSSHFFNKNHSTKIYHYSNKGYCSWFDFAKEIFKLANINDKVQLNSITTEEYLVVAERPKNSVINNKKIENDYNIDAFNWKDSLKKCLSAYELANSIKGNE